MSEGGAPGGVLFVVATPIGNLEDVTYRAVRVLGEADVIAAEDTRTARKLLSRHRIEASRLVSYFEGNEAERAEELVGDLRAGRHVALISEAGMPGVSDPGERLVAAAARAGARVEVVPGPSAALAALAASGLPTARFLFVGFLPREPGPRRQELGKLRSEPATMIFFEAPDRVAPSLADLADAFGGSRRAALARELTKLHEEVVRGTLADLGERFQAAAPRGECTLVVEGAAESEAEAEPVDIEAALGALLDQGLGPKDAAARLVVKTGKPRRALYQLALSLQRGRSSIPRK